MSARRRRHCHLGFLLALLGALGLLAAPAAGQDNGQIAFDNVDTWAYQQDGVSPEVIGASPFDLVVVDGVLAPLSEASTATVLTPSNIAAMKQRDGQPDRLVLARLNVGQARDTRYYWKQAWADAPPDWLAGPDPDVPGRHFVRYWQQKWQTLLLRGGEAYLSRLLKLGVDGVYLDGTTAYRNFADRRATAAGDMAALVAAVAGAGRTVAEDWYLLAKADAQLLGETAFVEAVDGVVAESLFLGQYDGDVLLNPTAEIQRMQQRLSMVQARDKRVFNLEYPATERMALYVVRASRELGYVPYTTVPGADRLVIDYNSDLRLQQRRGVADIAQEPRGDMPQADGNGDWPPDQDQTGDEAGQGEGQGQGQGAGEGEGQGGG